jgi:hypothetical protein
MYRGEIRAETESEITAAQDRALQTEYRGTKILQTEKADVEYVNNLMRQ